MKLVRMVFIALAILLPASWTVARAGDEAPAETKEPKKKAKKGKKADKDDKDKGAEGGKKAE